ncbi:MAG: alpha/beta hydrolase [Actinobacteria bacterium]|nr:alpha/beta hydrolase [Actinomycetota bacterium]HRY11039.1 alpha/beta hydrolase [Candidatus Nanopelagicales bacterium]
MALLHTARGDFETIVDGPEDGPLILLLHGFPELNISWRHQIPALAAAGYRVVAPNQRGYQGSVRDGSYATADLAEDVVAMIDALGADKAIVVGHDWGGGVAWTVAHRHPERVERLVAMNCPPPSVLAHAFATNPAQLAKSWYMFFFQIPRLPEKFVVDNMPRALIGGSYNRKAWDPAELAEYEAAFATAEDARGPVNWYRGAMRHPLGKVAPITVPVLIIWGTQDRFLGLELIAPQALRRAIAYGNEPDIVLIEDAGHFVQNEAPEQVNAALLRWLGPA